MKQKPKVTGNTYGIWTSMISKKTQREYGGWFEQHNRPVLFDGEENAKKFCRQINRKDLDETVFTFKFSVRKYSAIHMH